MKDRDRGKALNVGCVRRLYGLCRETNRGRGKAVTWALAQGAVRAEP